MFPADGMLIDALTAAREDELDKINLMLKAPPTAENIYLSAQRLSVPNTPELEFLTQEHHACLLDHYIKPRFANALTRKSLQNRPTGLACDMIVLPCCWV